MPVRLRVFIPGALDGSEPRIVDVDDSHAVIRFGRSTGLEVTLPFRTISSVHGCLTQVDGGWVFEDRGSANGSFVDGVRVPEGGRQVVRPGQRLRLADVEILFDGPHSAASEVRAESTATLARRLVSDLFRLMNGEEAPRVVVSGGPAAGRVLRLSESDRSYAVGRGDHCDLVLPDEEASRENALLLRTWEGVQVTDLGSKNGVLVQGQRIMATRRLHDGDQLRIGGTLMTFDDPEERYLRQIEEDAATPAKTPPPATVTAPTPDPAPPVPPNPNPTPPRTADRATGAIAAAILVAVAAAVAWLVVG